MEIFRIVPLSFGAFSSSSFRLGSGTVTCSVPIKDLDGRPMVAVGCDEGIWVGFRDDPQCNSRLIPCLVLILKVDLAMRQALRLKTVTQCAALGEFGLLLVLANKALYAYCIDSLLLGSPATPNTVAENSPKISGDMEIHQFRVGKLDGHTLIITVQRRGLDSIFRLLEPEWIEDRRRSHAMQTTVAFKKNREFYIPSPTYDVVFLKAKLAILNTNGFEILDLDEFKSVNIPPRNEGFFKRLFSTQPLNKPLAIFATHGGAKFILCYDTFGLYVDRHGDPHPDTEKIEWSGTAEHAALHSSCILLFSRHCIEVRDLQTAKLMQKMQGSNIQCLWDGRGADAWMRQQSGVMIVDSVAVGNRIQHEIHELRLATD
ncbi:Rho guanine nucleotide exchange factor [Paramarasmius palmivorus]|uniref:Rho guanine nucleotide exchange factor n=1 Tax=Paramarasmius palmivorus TaxID=297713 RepID=A0AAW0EG52_9AGAR